MFNFKRLPPEGFWSEGNDNFCLKFSLFHHLNQLRSLTENKQMKKYLVYPLFFLVQISIIAQKTPELVGLETDLNAILAVTKAPGFAVAVVKGNDLIYARGFGYRDYENKVPADENTLFAIGSSTKAFTCGILGQLRNEDKLSFDDSPIKYIPDLRFFNDEMNNQITIQDLMCHRTGLPRHDFSWYLFPTFNRDSLMKRIPHQEPFTGVRSKWYYNNFMFLTQGVIAEKITGKSWEENINERFFQPLDMKRSNASIAALEKSSNAALGYELENETDIKKMDYYKIAGMAPAGSINSSVYEMANWLKTWINGGQFNGKEILSASYVGEAAGSQMVVSGSLPDDEFPDVHLTNYGYGWFISSYKGHYRVEHGGNIDGFSANVAFYPSDSIGIVVLTNQNGSAVPALVRNTVADRMLDTKQTDWASHFSKQQEKNQAGNPGSEDGAESSKIPNTKPSHVLQDFIGSYDHPGYGTFEIESVNDSLFARFKLLSLYLQHFHYDIFDFRAVEDDGSIGESIGTKINFLTNDAGDISQAKIRMDPMIDPIVFKRSPKVVEVDQHTLQEYVGEFDLMGTSIKTYLKNEDTLFLFITGQSEYELLATGDHKFVFKALDGFKLEFLTSGENTFNELKVIQPNGTYVAQRK